MSSRVKVKEEYGILEMILEKKMSGRWEKVCITNNHNIIYEYFKMIKDNIKKVVFCDGTTSIVLDNDISLDIPSNVNNSNLEVFKPVYEGIIHFNRQEKKKKVKALSLRCGIVALTLSVGIGVYELKKEMSSFFSKGKVLVESLDISRGLDIEEEVSVDRNIDYIYGLSSKEDNIRLFNYMTNERIGEANYNEYLPDFGVNKYDDKYLSVVENYGEITDEYATISGIDVEVINCLLAQERGIHSDVMDSGGAIGVAQIQVNQHLGSTLSLYNVLTGEVYDFTVTMDLLKSPEGSIKVCVAILQRAILEYNGNILLALQAYNYGEGAVDTVIRRSGCTLDEINEKYRDLSWIDVVYRYSDKKGGYGDKNYINKVLSRYPSDELTVIYRDNPVILNVKNMSKSKRLAL